MLSCETCRAWMLEYLYDLLEGDDAQAFQAHLTGCPACQSELVKAKGQQQLLAAAAKMAFPEVRFTAPPAPQPPVVLLQRPRRVRPWRRWAVAASVLLALGVAAPA